MTTTKPYNRREDQEELRRAEQELYIRPTFVTVPVGLGARGSTSTFNPSPTGVRLGSEDGLGEAPLMFQGHWFNAGGTLEDE